MPTPVFPEDTTVEQMIRRGIASRTTVLIAQETDRIERLHMVRRIFPNASLASRRALIARLEESHFSAFLAERIERAGGTPMNNIPKRNLPLRNPTVGPGNYRYHVHLDFTDPDFNDQYGQGQSSGRMPLIQIDTQGQVSLAELRELANDQWRALGEGQIDSFTPAQQQNLTVEIVVAQIERG